MQSDDSAMGQRGRRSATPLSLIFPEDVRPGTRPKPPADLTKDQAEEWRAIVDRMRSDWFPRETHPLLVEYCRRVVELRRIGKMIDQVTSKRKLAVDQYERLLRLQHSQERAATSLATKLRLTPQSRYDKKKQTGSFIPQRPWEEK
jgi:hypothetical protein